MLTLDLFIYWQLPLFFDKLLILLLKVEENDGTLLGNPSSMSVAL
jgi:hypothetical protein